MKNPTQLMLLLAAVLVGCSGKTTNQFTSERLSKAATITIDGTPRQVFPLFGAFEERKVDHHWDPKLIFPDREIIEVGTTFRTFPSHLHGRAEDEFIWHVVLYDTAAFNIRYLVSTPNRLWSVDVACEPQLADKTNATVTYTYIGLNERGNELNREAIAAMFKHDLKDWEEGINYYLKNGQAINAPK